MATMLPISGTPAEIYERHMVPAIFSRWAPDLLQAARVQTGERVLDVACGTGAVTRLLAERVGLTGNVVSLDINPGMLAVARRTVVGPNIEWLESSALDMPLPDATFDAVVCQQGLQFFPDRPAALSEMRVCSSLAAASRCPAGGRSSTPRAISRLSRPWLAESVPRRRNTWTTKAGRHRQ